MKKSHTATKPMTWVRDAKGNTYLCDQSAVSDSGKIIDQSECLDESENPHNN